jgi:hypothetical protein
MHLADPCDVLCRLAGAVRPGGWLVAEEPDLGVAEPVDRAHPLAEVFDFCFQHVEFASAAGIMDFRFGKVLPVYMEALGLVEMGDEGVARITHGGNPQSRMWIQTWQRIDDAIIAKGVLTRSEVQGMRRAYEDPTFVYRGYLLQSVWGRKALDERSDR